MSTRATEKRRRVSETDKKVKARKKYKEIVIVTHESCEPTFYSCVCDDMIEHANNLSVLQVELQTYVCVLGAAWRDVENKYHDGLELVKRRKFSKTLVEQTSELKDISCDLMLILCHGMPARMPANIPYMAFFDSTSDLILAKDPYATNAVTVRAKESESGNGCKEGRFEEVTMQQVVHQTGMCVMMCCYAGRIVDAHLASEEVGVERSFKEKHEYFYFDTTDGLVSGYSIEILISWIINLVDCQRFYDDVEVSELWRRAMLRIMQTVDVFGDDNDNQGFYDYLCAVGLVVDNDEMSKKMQVEQPDEENSDGFQVGGHKMNWLRDKSISNLLPEFMGLKLVTVYPKTYDQPRRKRNDIMTPALSEDIVLSSEPGVDTFLKTYEEKKIHRAMFGDSDSGSEVYRELQSDSDSGSASGNKHVSDSNSSASVSGTAHHAVLVDLTRCLKALRAMDV